MKKQSTDELWNVFEQNKDYNKVVTEIRGEYINNLSEYLNTIMANISISELAQKSNISESYLYKLLEGSKTNPSRNYLIKIAFGLELDVEQANELLRFGSCTKLDPRVKRDIPISFCLAHKYPVYECEQMLLEKGEKGLTQKKKTRNNSKRLDPPLWIEPFCCLAIFSEPCIFCFCPQGGLLYGLSFPPPPPGYWPAPDPLGGLSPGISCLQYPPAPQRRQGRCI